eukprot:gb/GECH01002595.1/.p1 GENE.gb/GECH01002595.1/~~gb/GECH01002595.1/.p1  ORF type:complete len:634 (+),score=134.99 gb/GECH01002595.1/:1-1902(+)
MSQYEPKHDGTLHHATGIGSKSNRPQPGEGSGLCPMNREYMATDQFGHAMPSLQHVMTMGRSGPVLLQDYHYLNMQTAFDRERIPERNVHAKGHGAHGVFRTTDPSIARYCKAKLFNATGKETPLFCRFSAVNFERGFPDTWRDPRGFSLKLYCQDPGEGIMDWIFLNTPTFFVRDPMKAPSTIHVCKRDPETGLRREQSSRAMDMFWDFMTLNPESLHTMMWLYGDRGLPRNYRCMNGYSVHSFKTRNINGEAFFMKIHLQSRQGVHNISDGNEAKRIAGFNPDYYGQDLEEAINNGNYPVWDAYYQVMSLNEAKQFRKKFGYDPFEVTKVWYHQDFPLHKFGEIVLNRNIQNYHAEVEQVAFGPGNLCPGFEINPHDRLFQARAFYYRDTQLHRLGSNYHLLPINNGAINGRDKAVLCNAVFARDGSMQATCNWGNMLPYYPVSSDKVPLDASTWRRTATNDIGDHVNHADQEHQELLFLDQNEAYEEGEKASRHQESVGPMRQDIYGEKTQFPWVMLYGTENADDVDFIQPGAMWRRVFDEAQKERWIRNVAADLRLVTQETILQRALNMFYHADSDCGRRLAHELGVIIRPSGMKSVTSSESKIIKEKKREKERERSEKSQSFSKTGQV